MRFAGVGFGLIVLLCLTYSLAQEYDETEGYGDGYGYSYDSYYQDMAGSPYEDEYGYYNDDDLSYYDYYGYYADDAYGYYDEAYESVPEECLMVDGLVKLTANHTVDCHIKVAGVDKQAANLEGGVDGIYRLVGCYNGKPMYLRNTSETRVLWFSGAALGDWDISRGEHPDDAQIILYGGEQKFHSLPLLVTNWHLGADLRSSTANKEEYVPITAKLSCADGRKVDLKKLAAASQSQTGPYLTNEEIEQKYKYIFDKYSGSPDPSPSVNFTFVVMLVMIGLTIVLAIPYLLLKKRGSKASVSQSFSQFISSSKKKVSGHTN